MTCIPPDNVAAVPLAASVPLVAERLAATTPLGREPLGARESLLRSPETKNFGTIMIVDDEPVVVAVVQKFLRQAGYLKFVTTNDPREAVDLIRSKHPDVIVLDITMPHVSGLNILEVIRGDRSLYHLPVVILTATDNDAMRQGALELGATDFLTKPIKPTELVLRVRNALVLKAHHDQLAEYSTRLEHEVQQRIMELAQSRKEVIHVLAAAAEFRDQVTGNHVLRVGRYASIIAQQLGFSPTRVELIEQAAILHDVGKIGISDTILHKPGKLNEEEIATMRKHCYFGQQILRCARNDGQPQPNLGNAQSPILQVATTIAISHHEKWDGSGYPHGLSGEAIPIEGRITAVADVFDALCSRRPYKDAMPLEQCFAILEEGRAKHFDPKVLDAFFARGDEVTRVATELADG